MGVFGCACVLPMGIALCGIAMFGLELFCWVCGMAGTGGAGIGCCAIGLSCVGFWFGVRLNGNFIVVFDILIYCLAPAVFDFTNTDFKFSSTWEVSNSPSALSLKISKNNLTRSFFSSVLVDIANLLI